VWIIKSFFEPAGLIYDRSKLAWNGMEFFGLRKPIKKAS